MTLFTAAASLCILAVGETHTHWLPWEQQEKSFVLDFNYRLLNRDQNAPLNIAHGRVLSSLLSMRCVDSHLTE